MNFTKHPEKVVLVLTPPLDLELLREFRVNSLTIVHLLEHASLGERAGLVHVQVAIDFLASVSHGGGVIVENSELGDEVLVVKVHIASSTLSSDIVDTLTFVISSCVTPVLHAESGESPGLELRGYVVTTHEGCQLDVVLHE